MDLKALVHKNRSYRRFYGGVAVDRSVLEELVDLTRFCASARNLQPLRFILSCDPERNQLIFSCLTWPVLGSWTEPVVEERPSAYILLLGDKTIHTSIGLDAGIAAQTIMLGATERGFGGCIFGLVRHEPIRQFLKIPEQYKILVVIALGKPKEQVVIEPVGPNGDLQFWRDEHWVHHVPKRSLSDIILDI